MIRYSNQARSRVSSAPHRAAGGAEACVRPILEAVRKRGDGPSSNTPRKFDALDRTSVGVPRSELRALRLASSGVSHGRRKPPPPTFAPSRRCSLPARRSGDRARACRRWADRAAARFGGAYIPAGRYPLPSTLMMTVIPAQVAGVKTICVASPRAVLRSLGARIPAGRGQRLPDGRRAGHRRVRLRHATVPKADRIVGPGNIYVAAAKKLLAGEVGIDFVAGPTEILIIAADGDPRFLAADMLAQAEHDVDACAILLTTSKRLAKAVAAQIERQLADLPTAPSRAQAIDATAPS